MLAPGSRSRGTFHLFIYGSDGASPSHPKNSSRRRYPAFAGLVSMVGLASPLAADFLNQYSVSFVTSATSARDSLS